MVPKSLDRFHIYFAIQESVLQDGNTRTPVIDNSRQTPIWTIFFSVQNLDKMATIFFFFLASMDLCPLTRRQIRIAASCPEVVRGSWSKTTYKYSQVGAVSPSQRYNFAARSVESAKN